MTETPDNESRDGVERVKIYSSDEDRIKILGEVFGNDSSRRILLLLARTEMTAGQILTSTSLSMSLVAHHLEKMQKAGIVNVSRTSKSSKNRDIKYYRAAPAILIVPEEAHSEAKKSKSLALSLRRVVKFAAIGVAGLASWLVAEYSGSAGTAGQAAHDPMQLPSDSMQAAEPFAPVLVGMGVVIIGLIAERVLVARKK